MTAEDCSSSITLRPLYLVGQVKDANYSYTEGGYPEILEGCFEPETLLIFKYLEG